MPTPVQIKLIHTLKGALSLNDETYRDILFGYGVSSSKDLPERKAKLLIDDLEIKAKAAGVWKMKRRDFKPQSGADPMTLKIRALWGQLFAEKKIEANTDTALAAYVKRMTGRDSIRWCSVPQKSVLIEAMKKWLARDTLKEKSGTSTLKEKAGTSVK